MCACFIFAIFGGCHFQHIRHSYRYKLCFTSFRLNPFLFETNFKQELVKNYDKRLTMVFNFAFRLYDVLVLINLQFGVLWWSRLSEWTWNNDYLIYVQLCLLHLLIYIYKLTANVYCERSFTTKVMIWIFPYWTFHLHVATFQQHLHMRYISLSWYVIPELVVPIRICFNRMLLLTILMNLKSEIFVVMW